MITDYAIETHSLGISFRSGDDIVKAVSEVNISLKHGKTLAIVGESGSGKTVSSLCLMGLLDKRAAIFDAGNISLSKELIGENGEGKSVFQPGDSIFQTIRGTGIAMIFQEPMTSLNPVMTCGDQITEMLRQHKGMSKTEARQRCVELFREVLLPDPEIIPDKFPFELSGGQRQRVMIAIAISCEPHVLIADEPTTALDVTVQKEILLLLKTLQQKHGMAMIFITHDLGVVKEIADDIVVMRRGEVVESGSANEVLYHPKHVYTQGLLACKPSPKHKDQPLPTLKEENIQPESSGNKKQTPDFLPDEKVLTVRELTKTYQINRGLFAKGKTKAAVDAVTFDVQKGETIGLVGESGCGKTTLSRMLLGLIEPTHGQIQYRFHGREYDIPAKNTRLPSSLRKEIQIVFQDPYSALNPKHTIGFAITEPMAVFGLHESDIKRKSKAIELLERVGLKAEHFHRYPHEFSGGQRQRIVIARALACEPSFIICDESVSALDVSVQAQVLNLLNDLKRDFGLTYLFISHDLNVVYYMSDRIMVMQRGKIVEFGTAREVFFHPQNEYTQKLIQAIPGGF
ncbi:MAG: ABC transporter ATP-binding protein [Flavobacteriales bacterium]|nr:ABC transporter ATP-binding protein [Flavobacteriales bacterium]